MPRSAFLESGRARRDNERVSTLTLPERGSLYLDLIRWNRPQGWLLVFWPTMAALWLASGGFPGWHLLLVFAIGTVLMRSAGCVINDVADRDFDRHVERTQARPITSGRISVRESLGLGAVLALIAFALVLTTNAFTVALSFGALAVTVAYPYTKRFFAMPQAVLGIAFSFGMPMAYAAIQNQLPAVMWWLVAGNLAWVLAYDTQYAMVDRNDDLKIGMRTSAITLGRFDVLGIACFYAVCVACWWMVGREAGLGAFYQAALVAVAAQALWHLSLIRHRDRMNCFKAFRLNHWIGLSLFAGVVLDLMSAR